MYNDVVLRTEKGRETIGDLLAVTAVMNSLTELDHHTSAAV